MNSSYCGKPATTDLRRGVCHTHNDHLPSSNRIIRISPVNFGSHDRLEKWQNPPAAWMPRQSAMSKQVIFISSVQKELADERRAIRDFVRGDALLRRFFDVLLFEDLPASDRRADDVYLAEVGRCSIYVGLFGQEYGHSNSAGLSPTELEFDRATELG